MFYTIARFELRYQLHNPVFWAAVIMFFLLTLAAATVESLGIGGGGKIHINAPTAVTVIQLMMSVYFMFVTTAFVANVVVRDDETGFGGIIRSTKVGKLPYMFGRFSGAFLGAALAFLAVPLAIWIGTYMPWVSPDLIGPNRLGDYMFGYFVIALPNVLITSAIFFAVACWTRSVTYSYLTVILFMFLYFAFSAMLRKWPDLEFASYLEPFGSIANSLSTRYLTPIQANTQAMELSSVMVVNRLVWLTIAVLIVVLAVWRFSFSERGISKRGVKRQAAREQKLAAVQPQLVEQLPSGTPSQAAWHQLRTRALFEMKLVLKSPALWVLAIIGVFNLHSGLNLAGRLYDVPMWPRTFGLVEIVRANSGLLTMLMAIYFSGEVVWRERERRINEIIDTTPLPNWIFVVSKLAGVVGALFLLTVVLVLLQSILFQLGRGLTDIEFGQWLRWFVGPSTVYVVQLSVLAIVIQAISPNKFIGWGLMLLYLISTLVFSGLGFNHPLINYATTSVLLSDINGSNHGGTTAIWLQIYWTAVAIVLVVIGHLMWRRGTAVTLKAQWRTLPSRLRGQPLAVLSAALLVCVCLGGVLYYNMNYVNHYWEDQDQQDAKGAQFEKDYSKYLGMPEPDLTDITLNVDLQPSRRWAQFDGSYRFVNNTQQPIELLHVRLAIPTVRVEELIVPGTTLEKDDQDNLHQIYRFNQPLQPGESGTLSFRTVMERRGLYALPANSRLNEVEAQPAPNGAYLTNLVFAPSLGMDRGNFLRGTRKRQRYGLAPEQATPTLEDDTALGRSFVDVDRVNTDITVTTDAEQTLVVTGEQVSDNVVDGRRTARFVSPIPTLNFITIQSAVYDVKTIDADGVKLSVYYHPEHPWNIDRMLSVMEDSLAYYTKYYGPYQYNYARIIERPDYGGGANSAPGTVGYSEKAGFTMDFRDPKRLDFLAYVTAHELGHQYWFHQLMPADVEGAEVMTETLSQYSALMIMKHRYGPDQIRQFIKYEHDIYLRGRRAEESDERPLARAYKQGYIHYNKGSIVMYLLQDRLGEERINTVLRGLIDRYHFKPAPYARSSDLVDGLLTLARTPQERELILDQFYRITLYDLEAKEAEVRLLPNGQFETTITINAAKYYADGKGNEEESPLNEQIDVGVFTAKPGDLNFGSENVLSIERLQIQSGEQQVRIVTAEAPAYVAVDPYLHFIDRKSSDNIILVSGADG